LEIIGEAAKKVPMDIREKNPGVEWRAMQECATVSFTTILASITTSCRTFAEQDPRASGAGNADLGLGVGAR
jgi:hypothetical protein